MCISPITLRQTQAKTGLDQYTRVVPCGRCIECLKQRANAWTFRLLQETKVSESAAFITFTYEIEPKSFNGNPTLRKTDFQKFMKRLRKKLQHHTKIKYYAVGEYGDKSKRPHYHAIMFNLPQSWLNDASEILTTWGHGHVDVRQSSIATIKYVTKYIQKGRFMPLDELDDREPEKAYMSKNMGINHLTPAMLNYYKDNQIPYAILPGGEKISLPRYFKEKIYTKEELKKMALKSIKQSENQLLTVHGGTGTQSHITWKKELIRQQERAIQIKRNTL